MLRVWSLGYKICGGGVGRVALTLAVDMDDMSGTYIKYMYMHFTVIDQTNYM